MTHQDHIIAYLSQHPEGAGDDELAAQLNIQPRQTVNQICRRLADCRTVRRERDPDRGNMIINYLITEEGIPQGTALEVPILPILDELFLLHDETAVKQFAYRGETQLSESQVVRAVESLLRADGWETTSRIGNAHGIDIEAVRDTERLVIEAKGEGSRTAMRVNYFVGALGELLQRMNSAHCKYALALPAHRQFIRLILRLPDWVQMQLPLCFFLVRQTESNEFEVGFIPSRMSPQWVPTRNRLPAGEENIVRE